MNRLVAAGLMCLLSPLVMGAIIFLGMVIFGKDPENWYAPIAWSVLGGSFWLLAIFLVAGKEGRGWSA